MSADELFSGCTHVNFTHHYEHLRSVTIVARDTYERFDDWLACLGHDLVLAVPGIGITDITLRFGVAQVTFGQYEQHIAIVLESFGAPLEPKEANP